MKKITSFFFSIDSVLFISLIPLLLGGLFTMKSFVGTEQFFEKQLIWIFVSLLIFFFLSTVDFRFLRKTESVVGLFIISCALLVLILIFGKTIKGATSWFDFGFFSFQPSDFAKLALIILLSKYFSKRHVEIANIKHVIVSGLYTFILFFLVMLQPDLGSGIIIFLIWFGMVLVSGISKKHLFSVLILGITCFTLLWSFGFKDYQKARIKTFINPMADIRGTGYNAHQSVIAVGSGQILGKGIGYGTQSRLNFLPEYETDFIFAAFSEEWGFIGVLILFISFIFLIFSILKNGMKGETNFETFFAIGLAIMLMSHFVINIGMNIGVMPVTGIPLPFVSYGGSHMIILFIGLGILMGMRKYRRATHRDLMKNEFLGI